MLAVVCALGISDVAGAQNIVWRLGEKDESCSEFALAGKNYSDYPEYSPASAALWTAGGDASSIPFVLPGTSDSWAGRRQGSILIRFNVASGSVIPDKFNLMMDFVETHPVAPPRFNVSVNDFSTDVQLPAGKDKNFLDSGVLTGNAGGVEVPIPGSAVKVGTNIMKITNVAGSWAVFDDIRLEASSKVRLVSSNKGPLVMLSAASSPALVYSKDRKTLKAPVKLAVTNWGAKAVKANVTCDGAIVANVSFAPGVSFNEVALPEEFQGKTVTIGLDGGPAKSTAEVYIKPAEKWTIYLVQQTHTDIGYTKPQTEILTEHMRYIDYAVEYCEATEKYPEDSKFRWTCEASWAVKEWLNSRPKEQVDKFLRFVRNGQIEVTAMFFNMSELSGEDNYKTFLSPLKTFHRLGIPVVTAMQNDVNGVAWCLADYLPDLGVKYMTIGSNGHRADIPFDRPTLFKWESPSGKSLLSFRADHYNTGNSWGIERGDYFGVENGVFSYISSLKHRDYDVPMVAVQYSGYKTDNSPPSMQECDIIRRWNEHYAWPKLRSATAREFLERVDKEYGDKFPVYRAAYPDWWTDGFGSAARESAASRTTQSDMLTADGILAMAALTGDKYPYSLSGEIERINENLLFYNEHTFGAAESIRNPLCENSQVQWAEKGSYVWDALKNTQMLYEKAAGRMQGKLWRSGRPTLTFFNTMLRSRSGLVKVYIDYELIPKDRRFSIVDEKGNRLKCQPLSSRSEGRYYAVMAENLPAFGYKTYEIVLEDGEYPSVEMEDVSGGDTFEVSNEYYSIVFDKKKGGMKSLTDKETGMELLDGDADWNAGEFVYESLEGDRHQMERKVFERYSREGMSDVRYVGLNNGSVYQSVSYKGRLRGCSDAGVKVEVRLFNDYKRIEVCCSMVRLPEQDPSGIYVAFPFKAEGGDLVFDVPGGTVESGRNQIPRSSIAWNTVQSFAAARNSKAQTIISTDEIPLFMLGEMLNDPYRIVHERTHQHMFSWIMNNYWTTNFRVSQEGELKWSYAITSSSDTSNSLAAEFGMENRCPIYARVCPPSLDASCGNALREKSFFGVEADNLLVVSCGPSRHGHNAVILNIRELDGKPGNLMITRPDGTLVPFTVVNALEERLEEGSRVGYELGPLENVFVMIDVE